MREITGRGFSYPRGLVLLDISDSSRDVSIYLGRVFLPVRFGESDLGHLLQLFDKHRKLMLILSNPPAAAAALTVSCRPNDAQMQVTARTHQPGKALRQLFHGNSPSRGIRLSSYYRITAFTLEESSGRGATPRIATLVTLQRPRVLLRRP